MTPQQWRRIEELFDEVRHQPLDKQAEFLRASTGDDPAVREYVMSLLDHDRRAQRFLSTPVLGEGFRLPWSELRSDSEGAAAKLSPEQIGGYRLIRRLAHGGMGVVYEATQQQPRRTVAVKLLRSCLASSAAVVRFRHEVEILGRLRHSGIAQIYEAGLHHSDDGSGAIPFFAMELVRQARPLTQYAIEHQLGLRERLRLFCQVCEAIHYGHLRGVVHRDLKPSNLLVDDTGAIKVIDFGVARATDVDMAFTTVATVPGELVGTLRYMSPEQCSAEPRDLDLRTDVYSLGVVLFELLTGQLPYDLPTTTVFAAAAVIQETPPTAPSRVDPKLSGDVETILLKSLAKDPDRRYQSVAELAQDLESFLRFKPIQARAPGAMYTMSRWIRRHRIASVAISFAVLSLTTGSTLATIGLVKARRSERRAIARGDEEARQRRIADENREESESVTQFFVSALSAADPAVAHRKITVHEVINRVAPQVDENFSDRPWVQARLHAVIGATYQGLGDLQAAPRRCIAVP